MPFEWMAKSMNVSLGPIFINQDNQMSTLSSPLGLLGTRSII